MKYLLSYLIIEHKIDHDICHMAFEIKVLARNRHTNGIPTFFLLITPAMVDVYRE
jgi:hypothetical protein